MIPGVDRAWRPNRSQTSGGHTAPTRAQLHDLAGPDCDRRHTAIGKTLIRRDLWNLMRICANPSPHLCEDKAVATAAKALDVRADVRHRHRGSSATEDGHRFAFSTPLLQNV